MKAYLATFFKENNIQDILEQAMNTQAAYFLLTLIKVFQPEKDQDTKVKI